MIRKDDVIKIGSFTKPHGIKGEIGLATHHDIFHRLDDPYVICKIDGIYIPFYIESSRTKTSTVHLLKLAMIDNEETASSLAGKEVYCPVDILESDCELESAWDSLIGYTLSDKVAGRLGEITDVDDSTINIILQIDMDGRELLIPAVDKWIVSVDHNRRHAVISVPEGLLDM